MNKEKISVIVPVRNEREKIEKCLDAIFSQTLKPHKVIVVDGNSTDDTVKNAKKFPVTVLYENYGTIAGARQVGIENATGEYVAFTDADCIPEKDWLETELKVLQRRNDAAGVGCRTDNVSEGLWEETINEISKTFLGSGRSIHGRQFKREKNVVSISSCHSVYRKQILDEIGGFNVKLKATEDAELNKRLRKKGYNLVYTPETKVLHDHKRGAKLFAKRMFQYGAGRGQIKLFDDIHLLLPFSLPFLVILGVFRPFGLLWLIGLYVSLLLIHAILISIKNRKPQFLLTVPFILVILHVAYSLGFWKGIFKGD